MKPKIFRTILLLTITFLCLITCSVPEKQNLKDNTSWIEEMTISDLQKKYADGQLTITKVVQTYLERIEAIDKNGPELNSIIIINPDALAIADELDRELKEGKSRGPMHGVPVILKDNIDTHDKMPTTAGATALRDSYPDRDSFIAKKLREAGAVILGKANLSEWANFRADVSSSGWSGVGGQTKNPYILDRNPCGSSSGSGVSVSANLCMLAIGTETNGSIVCPSNNNGIVGLKPTVGLLSRSGIIPISFTQDTPGPMGRTVEDVATALGAMTGIDENDSKTVASEGKFYTGNEYTCFLKADGVKGKRFGLLKKSMGYSDKVDTLVYKAVSWLRDNGAEVVEVEMPEESKYGNASFEVLLYEFKAGLENYFASLGDDAPVRNLADLIEFNLKDTVELRYFDQKLLEMAEKKGDLDSREYKEALAKMLKATRENGIDRVMDENRLDALIAPTGSPAWKTDLVLGDHFVGGSSSLAAVAGYPAITLPMGFIQNLPVGITFFGRAWSEPVLLEIAYSYEQGTRHRKAPGFLLTD